MRLRFWFVAPIALALGGCELAPRYAPPSIPLPAKFRDEPAGGMELSTAQTWWRSFNDRRLDDLEAQVDAANPDLAAAIAANDAAVARAAQAAAGLLPQIDANGQITANRQSNNRPNFAGRTSRTSTATIFSAGRCRTRSISGDACAISSRRRA